MHGTTACIFLSDVESTVCVHICVIVCELAKVNVCQSVYSTALHVYSRELLSVAPLSAVLKNFELEKYLQDINVVQAEVAGVRTEYIGF